MAVNESRSMNADLARGITDGVVKKAAPDRGGVVEQGFISARNTGLHQIYDPSLDVDGEVSGRAARRLTSRFG